MRKSIIHLLSLSLIIVFILSALTGCNEETRSVNTLKSKLYSEMDFSMGDVAEGLVCENENFALSWDREYIPLLYAYSYWVCCSLSYYLYGKQLD